MISLTPFEHGLRRVLVERVQAAPSTDRHGCLLSYVQFGRLADPEGSSHYPMTRPPFRGLNEALGHVSMYEVEHGRPMLTAIVVQEDSGHPGSGFAKLGRHLGFEIDDEIEFWKNELEEVVRFWTGDNLVLVVDAALETVMQELASIKQLIRRGSVGTK